MTTPTPEDEAAWRKHLTTLDLKPEDRSFLGADPSDDFLAGRASMREENEQQAHEISEWKRLIQSGLDALDGLDEPHDMEHPLWVWRHACEVSLKPELMGLPRQALTNQNKGG